MRGRRHCAADVATSSETQGIDDFAIADMAVSTGVHSTSLYRRWGSREDRSWLLCSTTARRRLPFSTPVLPVRI
jgi:hypothetical protein